MSKRRATTEIGFIDTPSKFADAIASLDASVNALDAAVKASKAASVNAAWRAQWNSYVRRWQLERDQYADWGSRLFLTVANARLEQFREHYLWWASDFEKRAGSTSSTSIRKAAAPVKDFSASAIPSELWWILGAGVVAFFVVEGVKR